MREEEKKRISQSTAIQKIFRKRWVFPAIYLVCAALILTAVLWFQSTGNSNVEEGTDEFSEGTAYSGEEPAVEVSKQLEILEMPVIDPESIVVQTNYYDDQATQEEQEAALVFYNNTYHPNTGIDLTMEDGQSFDVVAAASGTVIKAEKDPILGYVVEVDHQDGLVTHYQSLANVEVESGDLVKQGEVLATAGQSLFNQEAKMHVHFEVRQDGVPVNPQAVVGKPLATIKDQTANESTEAASEKEEQAADTPEQGEKTSDDREEQPSEENSRDAEQNKKQEESSSSDADKNA